jgi:hypothetical protein
MRPGCAFSFALGFYEVVLNSGTNSALGEARGARYSTNRYHPRDGRTRDKLLDAYEQLFCVSARTGSPRGRRITKLQPASHGWNKTAYIFPQLTLFVLPDSTQRPSQTQPDSQLDAVGKPVVMVETVEASIGPDAQTAQWPLPSPVVGPGYIRRTASWAVDHSSRAMAFLVPGLKTVAAKSCKYRRTPEILN